MDFLALTTENRLYIYEVIGIMLTKKIKIISLIFLWSSLILPVAHAQGSQSFAIELIIFEQLTSNSDEQWPKTPYSTDIYDIIEPEMLEVTLTDVAKKLRRPRYKVLYHAAWKQELLSKRSAKPMLIENRPFPPYGPLTSIKTQKPS